MSLTLFRDPVDISPVEDIEDRALPHVVPVGGKLMVAAGCAGVGLIAGGPMLALAAGLFPVWQVFRACGDHLRNQNFVRRNEGCIAHLIKNRPDMEQWIEICGPDEVIAQLLYARKRGQKLTNVARVTLNQLVPPDQLPPEKFEDRVRALAGRQAADIEVEAIDLGNEGDLLPLPAEVGAILPAAGVCMPLPLDQRKDLIAALKQDCPALYSLIKSHPARFVGRQRSGKTTLVKLLVLLRMLLIEGHQAIASTPHAEAANPYPQPFQVVGLGPDGSRDYAAIERAWFGMANQVEANQEGNVTYVWDEFGLMDKAIVATEDNPDPIKGVMTSCLRETKKYGIYPIFIVHGETAAFLPGVKGLVRVFMESTIRVETLGEAVEGPDGLEEYQPTGRFTVTDFDKEVTEGQIPAWLTESYLLGLLGAGDQVAPIFDQPYPVQSPAELNFEPTSAGLEAGLGLGLDPSQTPSEPALPSQWEFEQVDPIRPRPAPAENSPENSLKTPVFDDFQSRPRPAPALDRGANPAQTAAVQAFESNNSDESSLEAAEVESLESPEEAVCRLVLSGLTQAAAIGQVFGVTPGNNKAYRAAKAQFESFKKKQATT